MEKQPATLDLAQTPAIAAPNDEKRVLKLLARSQEQDDSDARELLIQQYRPLIEKLARRFLPSGIPLDDLVQEGYIGLLHAIKNFKPDRQVKFITYATHCVGGHLRHFLRDRGQIIKEPAWLQELSQRVRRASDALLQQHGRQPTTNEIADYVGLPEETVAQIENTRAIFSVASLDESYEDGTSTVADRESFGENGQGVASAGVSNSFEVPVEEKVVLESALKRLKEIEQKVIYLFYYEDFSQTEIAKQIGISNNYVSHILKNSARKLQQMYRSEAVREAALQYERKRVRMIAGSNGHASDEDDDTPASIVDPVTGLYSRDYFEARLEEELSRAVRHSLEVSVVRVALGDDMPEAGLFARVAQTVKSTMRRADIVARTDTREIGAVLPHTGESCATVTDRLYDQLQHLQTELSRGFSFTIGAASFPDHRKKSALFEAATPGIKAA
jgi:RNA polymerase sigma factor (sigma-70 family)